MSKTIKSKSLNGDDYSLNLNIEEVEALEIIYDDFVSSNTLDQLIEKEIYTEYETTVLKGIVAEILKQKK